MADKNTIPDIYANSEKLVSCMVRSRTLKKKNCPPKKTLRYSGVFLENKLIIQKRLTVFCGWQLG